VASHIAIGDRASGHIAVGRVADGARVFICTSTRDMRLFSTISAEEVRFAITEEYPNLWRWFVNFLTAFVR
jgi:hypothetical protein